MARDCTCAACVACCEHYPGWMTVGEARDALALGWGPRMMVDWWNSDPGEEIYVVCPAVVGREGKEAPDTWTIMAGGNRCTMLTDEKRCSLHGTAIKPRMCREVMGCSGEDLGKADMWQEWDTDEGRAVVAEWRRICDVPT